MFPFNQSHDLVYQIHPSLEQQQLDHQIIDPTSLDGFVVPTATQNSRRKKNTRKKSSESQYDQDQESGNCDDKQRKAMHREIERLRRLEMGKLYQSLRSLLPLDFIKGKRSISDHMNQSVNYINHLQGSIKELELKKNKLKKMCDKIRPSSTGTVLPTTNYCSRNDTDTIVQVAPCFSGVEILISSGVMEEGLTFPLSRVMEVLILEGLIVISCATVKINERFLHTIQSEVSDGTPINIPAVEQKLKDIIFPGYQKF